MTSSESVLLVEQRAGVRVLTLNRPDARNALNRELIDSLADEFDAIDRDESVKVIVLAASGEKAFCAGADLRERASGERIEYRNFDRYRRFKLEGGTKPTIAAVNGPAVAAGFELVLACDMAVCSPMATFALPEVRRGLFAGGGGMIIGRRLPAPIALEIGLTGAPIDAERAHALGLVNRVVPAGDVVQTALQLADSVASNGPLAVAATRRVLRSAPDLSLDALWAANDSEAARVIASDDAREGTIAFIENRQPNWKGR